ncbi:MAG: N-acetyl-gamma-glutamyl-phosphate reductase [Phycisphaerae bacterium]|nr:N-acetyl-gamma-glutamyl-phosphate reductase [Phycisphaerae bacterium]
MVKAGILGARSYSAGELIRLLLRHGGAELTAVGGRADSCGPLVGHHPQFAGRIDLEVKTHTAESLAGACDMVFCALPHAVSIKFVPGLLDAGLRVVDFSADYRIKQPGVYEKWYKTKADEANLAHAVYGLPELYRKQIKAARLVANPGCYPTGPIIALAPLLKAGLIEPDEIIIDAKSGVSGAGRNPTAITHYPECTESIRSYAVGAHRHQPEISEQLSLAAGAEMNVFFVPHLTPMDRGILSTIYTRPRGKVDAAKLKELYAADYAGEPFVVIRDDLPATKDVTHTNMCHVGFTNVGDRLVVVTAVDNLIKGAAGQALQNMNIMFGLDETAGLL